MAKALLRMIVPLAVFVALTARTPAMADKIFDVKLANPAFREGVEKSGVPRGWSQYGGGGKEQKLQVVDVPGGGKALLVADGDPTAELGVVQTFDLKGDQTYQVTAKVRAVAGVSTEGAYLQFRFLPSGEYVQTDLAAESSATFSEISLKGTAPLGTTKGVIYLYTHREPTPKLLVTDLRVRGGLPPPPPPPPPPIPPQYKKLKSLYLDIPLVKDGKPIAAIVVPASGIHGDAAAAIQRAIEARTGVTVPVVADSAPQAAVPIQGNLIVLGNRSTNRTMRALYDLFYCLVDLKYPGPEGYVLRSVHNPFGDGHGVVIVGGSDAAGVEAGARALAGLLAKARSAKGEMSIGWTMVTKLGKGVKPPTDIRDFQTWEASKGYGSIGYFGWCSISKRMAMYYMTGDRFSAREVVRLSFPDKQAIHDIETIDDERIENKHDPLAGFYHYNAHMAILFWDLIEESPVFSDEERLKVTNAFARQLNHRRDEGVYGLTQPPAGVSTRHGQWSAIALYCLGRYFNKDYPHPVWAQCMRGGQLAFQSLHRHAWIAGESDNLFWYNTGIAPVFTYMVLTGDRKPLENGVLATLLRGQEVLVSGRVPDWALDSASMDLFNKAAYLTGDGRWISYRERTGVDTNVFRLGQSFWPEPSIKPRLPDDLVGKWSIHRLPRPAWGVRGSGIPFEQSFYVGSYRSAADASGDYILLDGFNGASRNPYHTFDILELRLAGRTILEGYHNQVITSADGMVEPAVAMDAALLYSDVVGPTATAVGEVPKAAFCNWRRTIAQRTGRYALVVDDLALRTDSENMKVSTTWQTPGGYWDPKRQSIRIPAASSGLEDFELHSCDAQQSGGSGVVTMAWNGAVAKGSHRIAFYLLGQTGSKSPGRLACDRIADNAAALALPQAAVAVVGQYERMNGDLVILTEDHLYGHAITSAGIASAIVSSDAPANIDWDFTSGVANVVLTEKTTLRLSVKTADNLRIDGKPIEFPRAGEGAAPAEPSVCRVSLPAGRHVLSGASPAADAGTSLAADLRHLVARGKRLRAEARAPAGPPTRPTAAKLPVTLTANVGGSVAAMVAVPSDEGDQLCVAEGTTVHYFTHEGRPIRTFKTDRRIRVLRWWDEFKRLLAGCEDEKVIAFDGSGRREWVFTSQMDPAVYEAAKPYWFKSAPGHEGIHGLSTGRFDGGKSRCFVGSACTLEILDEAGKLVKRTPVFWGPCWKFQLVAAANASPNLLIAQWPNGGDDLPIVSSKAMVVTGRGYYGVPAGHTFVGGWTAQNRTALLYEDLDGDGKKELATAVNGTWNRVTVYSEQGQPLANAQFGPGASTAPRAQMRDMVAADLDGDGKKELIVGISEGLVLALSPRCQKLWSTRLPNPPVSLQCIYPHGERRPWIVAGCEDGTVAALDNKGTLVQLGKVMGRPAQRETIGTPAGPMAVFATDQGEIKGFKVGISP